MTLAFKLTYADAAIAALAGNSFRLMAAKGF